jgi:hypothetical protein
LSFLLLVEWFASQIDRLRENDRRGFVTQNSVPAAPDVLKMVLKEVEMIGGVGLTIGKAAALAAPAAYAEPWIRLLDPNRVHQLLEVVIP